MFSWFFCNLFKSSQIFYLDAEMQRSMFHFVFRFFFYICVLNSAYFFFQDSELNELRATIEALKRQSGLSIPDPTILSPGAGRRHTSPGMVNTNDYISSPLHQIHHQSPHHGNRPGFNTLPMPTGKNEY